ncbi:MAG: KamA family radical SAM protein [Syntrophobacterales bacterium]|nr:KamA family radical SAM protein [Syntrophobacterales bacterium]
MRAKELARIVLSDSSLRKVHRKYPFRITDHIARLIHSLDDPIARQFIPSELELEEDGGVEDPLGEESLSPVPHLVHRYPDRVLWLITSRCAARCRFCTRKRLWKRRVSLTEENISRALNYIRQRRGIRDVLISGGDPLLVDEELLERVLHSLRAIKHVAIVRIGTRLPLSDPERVTREKILLLSRYQPLYVNIHVNHPRELSDSTRRVLEEMASAAIPLGSQTVLLRGINDDTETLRGLFLELLRHRVRPYYLLQMDLMRGTAHFRTPLSRGLEIMKGLRHTLSGLAIPHFIVDLPRGGGKVGLVPSAVESLRDGEVLLRNRQGGLSSYPLEVGEFDRLMKLLL